ncbi:MAG TPA: POTRA domain-containing protein [Verrucomicrobiae bacterium]
MTGGTALSQSPPPAGYRVSAYDVEGNHLLPTNAVAATLAGYTGTNVSLLEIVKAAGDLQTEFRVEGYPQMSIAIAREQITNGIVTLNVFQTVLPQIVISGVRYFSPTNNSELPAYSPPVEAASRPAPVKTNAPPSVNYPSTPSTAGQMAADRAALLQKMAALKVEETDHRIHVATTNAGPRFEVEHYLVLGNSALTPREVGSAVTNIDGAFGTNVSFAGIQAVVEQLQLAYHDRGYATVAVTLPQQKLTNATVKIQILEGRLAAINVVGNRYFSSNNVMRALPSLRTNILINAPVLQAELNRANANQDRQIYTLVGPGPEPGTSELTLKVKDQLPLHGKLEFNNQSSPGTPELRVNSSAVYGNLWGMDHSLGVQYSFSPEDYKAGNQWNFYDRPSVVNYSFFYRMPIGSPDAISDTIANNPGSFGYSEATRQFRLPPPSGQAALNVYASRATIDTGVATLATTTLFPPTNGSSIDQQEVQQGITINDDVGFQLSKALPEFKGLNSTVSGGLDYKLYNQANYQTNIFIITSLNQNQSGQTITNVSETPEATPATVENLDYLPLNLGYSANVDDFMGPATFGLTMSANLWYSSRTSISSPAQVVTTNGMGQKFTNNVTEVAYKNGRNSLDFITGSPESSGHWVVFRPSYTQHFIIHSNWVTTFTADGQWANEPLISNEQFGIGGVNSVRGYHEGEVFGDEGWHLSLEQDTPPHYIGTIHGTLPVSVQGSVYMDRATVYLMDPQGRAANTQLWGTGIGISASVGPNWQAHLLFSVPLISTSLTPRDLPYFNFSLVGQF